jgi:hypothetical protein
MIRFYKFGRLTSGPAGAILSEMSRWTLLVCAAVLFAPAARAQPQAAPAAPAKKSAAKSRGKAAASATEGPDLDAAAGREIPCPKGFVAERTAGPHLTLAPKEKSKKPGGRRGKKKGDSDSDEKAPPKKRALSRRCVPEATRP